VAFTAVMSDLSQFSQKRQRQYPLAIWSEQHELYGNYRYYTDGWIFDEVVDAETLPGHSVPKRYPLAINFVNTLCTVHSTALWGQFDNHVVTVKVDGKTIGDMDLIDDDKLDMALIQGSYDCQVDGGVFYQVKAYSDDTPVSIIERPASLVYPVWHPENLDQLLEIILAYEIDASQASKVYGVNTQSDYVVYKEIWTPTTFEVLVDNKTIGKTENILGEVPFVYVPRMRSNNNFYGVSLVRDVVGMQDEINLRMADLGDQVNYEAHAVKWVRNYTKGNPSADLPLSGDAVWDLGTAIGSDKDPEAGVLSGQALPSTSLEYVRMIKELLMNNAFVGPVDFGEDEGSQRSGATLKIRKEPVTRLARWGRVYWRGGLQHLVRLAYKAKRIRQQASERGIKTAKIEIDFAPLLPRDRMDLITEIVQLSEVKGISIERILDKLGDIENVEDEITNIKQWVEYLAEVDKNSGTVGAIQSGNGVSGGLPRITQGGTGQ